MLSLRHIYIGVSRRCLLLALLLAIVLVFLLPGISEAHAILLKSDPAKDAILTTAPSQVRMWFSENLNPTFSTALVLNSENQRVDVNGAIVVPTSTLEMDVSLKPTLPPDVYIVVWRTQSADDGHILRGSFIFSVANPDGTVPKLNGKQPGADALGGGTTSQFDLTTLFNLLMVTLVDIGVVFWVGGQLWHSFVLQLSDNPEPIELHTELRFTERFSLIALRVLFLANIGVLLGQALSLTAGRWDQALSPNLLFGLISNGNFGAFWVMREVVITLAMALGGYTVISRKRSKNVNGAILWANLTLALALLIAMVLSGHAAAVTGTLGVYAILVDWLHLLAASLWIGGMMYIATIYLPILKEYSLVERTRSLLTILPRFSPLAVTGVIIMAVTGPFNATVHMTSWDQLFATAYGRTLVLKVLLVCALLITSAIHVFIFRPRLKKDFVQFQAVGDAVEAKLQENTVARQTNRLTTTLRWEPLLGMAVLLCTGLLNTFAGTLLPTAGQQTATVKPFSTTITTDDHKFTVKLNITPNRFGPNDFTVTVLDNNGKPDTNVGVSLYITMLDMDMGTDTLNLQPDGKGNFTINGDLSMGGHWQVRVQIRTPDDTLHDAKVKFVTSS